jgi:dTDP-4-amino-4,6-dideoxygalactose transaminase
LNLESLNGFFPRVPLAVPFWTRETYLSVLRCLASGQIIEGPDAAQLCAQLEETLGVTQVVLCGSGSLALELALRACAIRAGDEVIIPGFCCSAVVPPVLAVGATPVLADIGDELNLTAATVDAAVTGKTRAVVVPHLFGNPADIGAIVELARAKNIRVIDDAAQAHGAAIDGKPAGSFGDFGILSFGAEKICSGLGGGVLLAQDFDSIKDVTRGLLMPTPAAELWHFASTLVWRRWRRWTLPAEPLLRREPSPHRAPVLYRRERMSHLQAAVAETLLRSLRENLAARRARVELYRELLGHSANVGLIPHRPGSACLTQVVQLKRRRKSDDPASDIIAALRNAGYEIQGSYVPIHLLSQFPQCVWDRLPNTEKLWPDLLELPCEPQVELAEAERIAGIVISLAANREN